VPSNFVPFWCGFIHAMQYYYYVWSIYYNTPNLVHLIGIHGICNRCSPHRYVSGFIQHVKSIDSHIKFSNMGIEEALALDDCSKETISRSCLNSWFTSVDSACALRNSLFPPPAVHGEALSIGIINRTLRRSENFNSLQLAEVHENRQISNIDALQAALTAHFGVHVDVCTFDDYSFEEQAAFCNAHNVLISSHGAQLCSIPFMPDYSLVVELFHPYYYVDHFYPKLSRTSGKSHYLSCSTHDPRCHNPHQDKGKKYCRSRDIVCNVDAIVEAIDTFSTFRKQNLQSGAPHNIECKKIG
jgi:hypothetical protein